MCTYSCCAQNKRAPKGKGHMEGHAAWECPNKTKRAGTVRAT